MGEKDLITQMVGYASWAQKKRLEFIESCLFWKGRVNRGDIQRHFGVSMPQASADLTAYRQLAGEMVEYDRSQKSYRPMHNFQPKFLEPNSSKYLATLFGVSQNLLPPDAEPALPPAGVLPIPRRRVEVAVLQAVVQAVTHRRKLAIEYLSMSNSESSWRFISPHALAFDRLRWHARAYCHESHMFKDFVLSRILRVGPFASSEIDSKSDQLWHYPVVVRICAHPDLTPAQRKAVEHDYAMENGEAILETRAALVFYMLQQFKKMATSRATAVEQQVCILNRREIEEQLTSLVPSDNERSED